MNDKWQPGQSGNPKGRPVGSRNKLSQALIEALYVDWMEHGPAAIVRVRAERPADYLRIVAALVPQRIEIERADNMDPADRVARIQEIADQLGLEVTPRADDPATRLN
jgi:hypothetical protein